MDALDILWILVAAVFIAGPEFIGKKRKKSASGTGRKPYRQTTPGGDAFPLPFPLPEVFPEETYGKSPEESREHNENQASMRPNPVPEPACQVPESSRPIPVAPAETRAKVSVRTSVPVSAAPESRAADRLKIDPKKMIIYSALMKPKFED